MPGVIVWLAANIATILSVEMATATFIAQTIVYTTISVALSVLSTLLLAPSINDQAQKQNFKQPTPPRRKFYGRVKLGGPYGFLKAQGGVLYEIILLCQGEIDAFESEWFADEEVEVDGSGNVTTPPRFLRSGVNYANIEHYVGSLTQTVDTVLDTHFDTWGTNHTLTGIAYARLWFLSPPAESFTTIYPAGMPQYNAVIRAAKVWDPRDPLQDADDPTTWEWTENAALIIMDYVWSDDGMRLPRDRIEQALDVWIARANTCDEEVATLAGTEARWRLSGGYELTAAPKTVLPLMLEPIDGRLYMRNDGAIVLDVADHNPPDIIITDDDLYAWIGMTRGRPLGQFRNEIRAKFVSPDYNYNEEEADPWVDEESTGLYGTFSITLPLQWCPSHSQARRRMKIESYRQNPDWVGQIITKARGMHLLKRRYFQLVISELDLNERMEIARASFDPLTGRVTVDCFSMPTEAGDWTTAEEGSAPGTPADAAEPTGDGPEGLAAIDAGSHKLEASVDPPDITYWGVYYEWRVHDDLVDDDDATWTYFPVAGSSGNSWTVQSDALTPDFYDVRAQWYTFFEYSAYSYVRNVEVL